MTKPQPPMYSSDKALNFGHALTGYNAESHKWQAVNVSNDGKLLFEQDPDTAQALQALSASIESLVEYCHDREEAFGEQINTASTALTEATFYIRSMADTMLANVDLALSSFNNDINNAISSMQEKHEEFLSQTDELFNNSRLTEQEIQDINNTVWGIEQQPVGE